jgi:glycosyltransferase involved in cell wall biosynthesis
MNPPLTIALLTYNRGGCGYLRQALEAILAQTRGDFELLVFDNHSTDQTPEIVMSYKDRRLTYIRQPPGGDSATNFIRAVSMSRGDRILLTHDDDIMEPSMVERQMRFLKSHPDLLSLATNVSLMDGRSITVQPRMYELEDDRIFQRGEYVPAYLNESLWMPTPTQVFQRGALTLAMRRLMRYIDQVHFSAGDIWISIFLNLCGRTAILADPLLRYRQHTGQESRSVNQSAPILFLIELLLKHNRRNRWLAPHIPEIRAISARFHAQNALFEYGREGLNPRLVRKIEHFGKLWRKSVAREDRAQDSVLPFEILLRQLGLEGAVPEGGLDLLDAAPVNSTASRGYRRWARRVGNGNTLFESNRGLGKIAILGSMLAGFLLCLEARRAGVEVVACLDSSPARVGEKVLGIPVVPHSELLGMKNLDAVILSNERDNEEAVKQLLANNLPDKALPLISWKELAREAVKPGINREVAAFGMNL